MELFGGAGHSKEIAKRISSKGMLIGIDRDQEALKAAQNNLKEFHNIKYVHDNHDNIKNILEKNKSICALIKLLYLLKYTKSHYFLENI